MFDKEFIDNNDEELEEFKYFREEPEFEILQCQEKAPVRKRPKRPEPLVVPIDFEFDGNINTYGIVSGSLDVKAA